MFTAEFITFITLTNSTVKSLKYQTFDCLPGNDYLQWNDLEIMKNENCLKLLLINPQLPNDTVSINFKTFFAKEGTSTISICIKI